MNAANIFRIVLLGRHVGDLAVEIGQLSNLDDEN